MESQGDPIAGLIFLIVFYGVPFILSAKICKDKNRSVAKGLFVTLCFGWLATIGLWLGLKTRDTATKQLY